MIYPPNDRNPNIVFSSSDEEMFFWMCAGLGFDYEKTRAQAEHWGGFKETLIRLLKFAVPYPEGVKRCVNCRTPIPGCRCGVNPITGWAVQRKTAD